MESIKAEDGNTRSPAALAGPGSPTGEGNALRLGATRLFTGVVVSLVAGLFHADSASANDHPATFAEYARSSIWTGVHLCQFAGMALLIAGLLVLLFALYGQTRATAWTARFGGLAAVAALALYCELQAVDGWRSSTPWMRGRVIGYLMALSGVAYIVQGWVIGTQGFSAANTIDAFVWESNRGDHVWFLVDAQELESKLAARRVKQASMNHPRRSARLRERVRWCAVPWPGSR
ncbi:hypothetical protein [Pseudarthrobacter sp. S9]|uniref:hypothetical protein n=1 Tax=Pseudarthrobacter sp. S9 TaxID=3418421 RepID=UPI003D0010EA